MTRFLISFIILSLLYVMTSALETTEDTIKIQSLRENLHNASSDGDSLQMSRLYRSIGREYSFASQHQRALEYYEKGLEIAIALRHNRAIAVIKNEMADSYSKLGERDKTIAIYNEISQIYLNDNDSISYAGVLINIAIEYQETGDLSQAVEHALLSIRIKEEQGDSAVLAFYYNKLAELYETSNPQSHEEWLRKALELSQTPEYTTFYTNITIYNNLAKLYQSKGDLEQAKIYYDSVYIVSARYDHQSGMETGLGNLALITLQLGDTLQAIDYQRKAVEEAERGENVFRQTSHLISAGKLEAFLGNHQHAIAYYYKGLQKAIEHGFPAFQKEAMEAISLAYSKTGDYVKAYQFYQDYIAIRDSIDGVGIRNRIIELEQLYETEKKEKQIQLLRAQNEYNIKRRKILSSLLVMSILLLSSISIILRQRNIRFREQKLLSDQKREIYRLNHENLRLNLEQKNRELSSMALQMAEKTQFLADLKEELSKKEPENVHYHIRQIDARLNRTADWKAFKLHFEEVHPHFFQNLRKSFSAITPNEEKLCAFIKMNLSTKEIALINNNTPAAVDKSRNRLRKKLEIAPEMNLKEFLDLI